MTVCKHESIYGLVRYNEMFKYFPEAELPLYATHQMVQPKTAMLITAEAMPEIWTGFESAMRENRKLKFSHNYVTDDNSFMLNRKARLLIACGLPKTHNVVSDRVKNLLTSGTWDFWVSLDSWKRKGMIELQMQPRSVPRYGPLTLGHDSVYIKGVAREGSPRAVPGRNFQKRAGTLPRAARGRPVGLNTRKRLYI